PPLAYPPAPRRRRCPPRRLPPHHPRPHRLQPAVTCLTAASRPIRIRNLLDSPPPEVNVLTSHQVRRRHPPPDLISGTRRRRNSHRGTPHMLTSRTLRTRRFGF